MAVRDGTVGVHTDILRALVKAQGLTSSGLARASGVSKTTVHGLMTGQRARVTEATAGSVAAALGVTADVIVDRARAA